MLGRIRAAMRAKSFPRFEGDVEMYKTFLGGRYESFKTGDPNAPGFRVEDVSSASVSAELTSPAWRIRSTPASSSAIRTGRRSMNSGQWVSATTPIRTGAEFTRTSYRRVASE